MVGWATSKPHPSSEMQMCSQSLAASTCTRTVSEPEYLQAFVMASCRCGSLRFQRAVETRQRQIALERNGRAIRLLKHQRLAAQRGHEAKVVKRAGAQHDGDVVQLVEHGVDAAVSLVEDGNPFVVEVLAKPLQRKRDGE